MKTSQNELVEILKRYSSSIDIFSENNPHLTPAILSDTEKLNDPETDRLDECFAFMMAQSNINFFKSLKHYSYHDISKMMPEWFEPSVSSTILRANIEEWDVKDFYKFKEQTHFNYYEKKFGNKEIIFSNEFPVEIQPATVSESYFSFCQNELCLKFKIKSFVNNYKLERLNFFLDYSKFSSFYKVLDEIFNNKFPIKIQYRQKEMNLEKNSGNLYYYFQEVFDLSIFKESNVTYFLYQFINYLNSYSIFTINFKSLNIELNKGEEIIVTLQLSNNLSNLTKFSNFVYTNCFVVKNRNILRGDPIYLKKNQTPYITLDRGSKKNFINIHKIQFFDLEHNDIILEQGKDYKIYKKYLTSKKGLDIIYYLKILIPLQKDIIILPFFNHSNLTEAHYLKNGSFLKLKRNQKLIFENLTVPTKAVFYLNYFNNIKFFQNIMLLNSYISRENLNLNDVMLVFIYFSNISINYKGIMSKIISQIKILDEKNEKEHFYTPYGAFHHKRYTSIIEVNRQNSDLGGISLLKNYLEFLFNNTSKINTKFKIVIKE